MGTADQIVFGEIREVFMRANLDEGEALDAVITMVALYSLVLGVPRDAVIEMLKKRIAGAKELLGQTTSN